MARCTAAVAQCRRVARSELHRDLRARLLGDLSPAGLNVGEELGQDGFRQIAKLDTQGHATRNDVRRVGHHFEPADRPDMAAGPAGRGGADRKDQLRRGDERILTLAHWRGAGVVGEAGDGDVVAPDCHDAVNDPNARPALLERSALLDMQFDVSPPVAWLAYGLLDAIGLPADPANAIGAGHAVPCLRQITSLQITRDDPASGRTAPEGRAFFVRPDHDLPRVSRDHSGGAAGLDHFERRQRAEIPVEVPAGRNRIDV